MAQETPAVDQATEQPSTRTANPPAPQRPLMDRRPSRLSSPGFRVFLIIGALVILVGVFFLWRYFGSYESTDDAQIDGHLNSVSARISGHVTKLLVEDNQYVQAGTPLIEIDPADYQVALDQAKANLDDAQAAARAAEVNVPITTVNTTSQVSGADADVVNARAGIAAAQQQYDAANSQLAAAEANNVKAQNDLVRYKELIDKQEISQQQYDQAVAAAKASAASVDAAKASASAAQQQINQAKSRLVSAEANLSYAQTRPQQITAIKARAQSAEAQAEMRKAQLAQAQLNLQYTRIVAPISGVVTNRTVEVGQNVQPGQELMRLINLDDIWVTANFKETQLMAMRVGQAVTVRVDVNGKDYKGRVQSISGASGSIVSLLPPENATGNYVKVVQRVPVKITFDSGETREHVLRPGMSVEPKVWMR